MFVGIVVISGWDRGVVDLNFCFFWCFYYKYEIVSERFCWFFWCCEYVVRSILFNWGNDNYGWVSDCVGWVGLVFGELYYVYWFCCSDERIEFRIVFFLDLSISDR